MRCWVAARDDEQAQLPALIKLARTLGVPAHAGVTLARIFQLTESCLGRPLVASCCCSTDLAPDEQTVLTMLALAPPPSSPGGTRDVPHGLPGALTWAVACVRHAFHVGSDDTAAPGRCPFAAPSESVSPRGADGLECGRWLPPALPLRATFILPVGAKSTGCGLALPRLPPAIHAARPKTASLQIHDSATH